MADLSGVFPKNFLAFVSSSSDPKVSEVYKALHHYASSDARQKWIASRKKLRKAALENEFFNEEEISEMRDMGMEPHNINKLVIGIQGASAVATAQRPDIKVFPLRESDPYLSELVKAGLEHVWLKNFGSDVVYDVVEERNLGGIGCIRGFLDENKGPFGAVVFEEDDAELWYWDDESKKRDRSDSHLIKAQLRTVQYIRDNYDIKDEEIIAINDDFSSSGVVEDTKTGEDGYKVKSGVTGDSATPSSAPSEEKSRMVWEIEAHMLKTEKEHWVVVINANGMPEVVRLDVKSKAEAVKEVEAIRAQGLPSPDGMLIPVKDAKYWPRRLNNRYTRIIVGGKLIPQPTPAPGPDDTANMQSELKNVNGLDSDGDPVLPVVFYLAQRLDKAYHNSPTFYAYDPNKSLCKRETQYTLALSKNLSAPVVRESTGTRWKDPKRPDRPGNELLLDKSARVPTRLAPGVIDFAAITNRIIEDKANIDDAYSLPEVMRGKIPKGIERMSGRLGLALQDTGTIMQNPAVRGLESCLERLGKLLLALMLRSWPRIKWESLATEDRINEFRPPTGDSEAADVDKSDELKMQEKQERVAKWSAAIDKLAMEGMTVVDFNIAITAGSSLPTNRLLKEETAIEKYKIGLYDRQAALEYSGEPHAKEVARRMDKREMEMAQAGVKMRKG